MKVLLVTVLIIITSIFGTSAYAKHNVVVHHTNNITRHTAAYIFGYKDGIEDLNDYANITANETWSTLANDDCNQGRFVTIANSIDFQHCLAGYQDAIGGHGIMKIQAAK